MAMNDINVTILENGTVRIDTDKISGPAHQAAEAALLWISKEMGGETIRARKSNVHHHHHNHAYDHDHNHTHSH